MDEKQEAQQWKAALAKAIRSESAVLDMSDAEVAKAAGIPTTTFWSIRKGRTAVKTAQLRKIAHALGMTPGQLFDLADTHMPKTDAEKAHDHHARRFPDKSDEPNREESDLSVDTASDDLAQDA